MENSEPEDHFLYQKLDKGKKKHLKTLSLKNKMFVEEQDDQSLPLKPDDYPSCSKAVKNLPTAINFTSTSSCRTSDEVTSIIKDDGLSKFRSSDKETEMNESLEHFQVKVPKKRSARKENKPIVKKKRHNRDIAPNIKQPSIESSFFKPQTAVKTAFLCPLCFKSYEDSMAQKNHMKNCAAKNKVPTKKLLEAIELQEKQADERKAMGLLAAPAIQPKKTISRKLTSDKDPQLQLALALSMSLQEAQTMEEIEEAHLLAGKSYSPLIGEMSDEHKKTLENFGFIANKPVIASTSSRSKKKRPIGPTPLQIRTQEERDRQITIRIAEVLMGDEPITQALINNVDKVPTPEESITLKSRLLKSYHRVNNRLWDKAQLSVNTRSLYSCNILELSLCNAKPESEVEETEQESSKQESPKVDAIDIPDIVDENAVLLELDEASKSTMVNNKMETLDEDADNTSDEVKENNVFVPVREKSISKSEMVDNVVKVKCKVDESSVMNLSRDWSSMLGASYMSDVLVIVKKDIQIHAHQVVFCARCYNMLDDVIQPNPERYWEMQNRILWPEIDVISAYAFLEFVYSGVIERHLTIFEHSDALTEVRVLARKYQLESLFDYLRDKSNKLKSYTDEISDQQPPKARINSESRLSKTSDNNIINLSEDKLSISSRETDFNSRSTVCDDSISNKTHFDDQTYHNDNVFSKYSETLKEQENKIVFHNSLKKNCDSSNISSPCVAMSQRTSTSIKTTLIDNANDRNFSNFTLTLNKKDCSTVQDKSKLTIISKRLEKSRSVSPDIFDDSETGITTGTEIVSKKHIHDSESEMNHSDIEIEITRKSKENLRVDSPVLNKKRNLVDQEISTGDKVANTLLQENCGIPKKSNLDLKFVSTRRKCKSLKNRSPGIINDNSEFDNLNNEKNVSGMYLKKKGDITMAIEKIQRLNAKSISESDSECESVERFPIKKRKNRFCLNRNDDSSIIDQIVKGDINSGLENDVPLRRRRALSSFEKKIEKDAAKNPALYNLTTYKPAPSGGTKENEPLICFKPLVTSSELKNLKSDEKHNEVDSENIIEPSQKRTSVLDDSIDAIFDLTQDSSTESKPETNEETCHTIVDEKDLSMFTKYKQKHSRNSIDKYRAIFKNVSSPISNSDSKSTEALLSDNFESTDDELLNINCNNLSSKSKCTDSYQSPSNVQKKLSSVSLTSKNHTNISQQILSSTDSDDEEQNVMKSDNAELSDLEIDLSDFSTSKYSNKLDKSRVSSKSQSRYISNRKTSNENLDNKETYSEKFKQTNSLTESKLKDTNFTVMKNDNHEDKNRNLSDQDTETECWIESASPNGVDKIEKNFGAQRSEMFDIYNEETDIGEMEDEDFQPKASHSRVKSKTSLNNITEVISKSDSMNEDRFKTSSLDCEISGVFSPNTSINLDFITNVSDEVKNLLDECKTSSEIFRNSQTSQNHINSGVAHLNSLVLTSTPQKHGDNLNKCSTVFKDDSNFEFANVELINNRDFSRTYRSNQEAHGAKSAAAAEKLGETINKSCDERFGFTASEFSEWDDSKIYKIQKSSSMSLANNLKSTEKSQSFELSKCEGVSSKNSSKSSLRTLKMKSRSENVLKTMSRNDTKCIDDLCEREFTRLQTLPTRCSISENRNQTTPKQGVSFENVTPLPDYSVMKTPELTKELNKYGLKAQKSHRAKQLLRYIYDELHPLVPVSNTGISSHSSISSSDDEISTSKRLFKSKSFEEINHGNTENNVESDYEVITSSNSEVTDVYNDYRELENNDDLDSLSQSNNSNKIETVFRNLIETDKNLHNKVLMYEPVKLEELHSTLKSQGLKCNINSLINFLDEQCITFRMMTNAKKSRLKKKRKH